VPYLGEPLAWVANTVPAIYTGAKMKAYRDWLPQRGFEANLAPTGSYVPERTCGREEVTRVRSG